MIYKKLYLEIPASLLIKHSIVSVRVGKEIFTWIFCFENHQQDGGHDMERNANAIYSLLLPIAMSAASLCGLMTDTKKFVSNDRN